MWPGLILDTAGRYDDGFATDSTTTDVEEQPWDLSITAVQEKAIRLLVVHSFTSTHYVLDP